MANYIRQFQTISRYESSLRQAPSVIGCLVNVLKYIKEILDDDSTQTLFEMIGHHLHTKDITAHYTNIDLLSDDILSALQYAFISVGVYTNERAQRDQMADFFEKIYDGSGLYLGVKVLTLPSYYSESSIIPSNYNDFTMWLISNPQIYESNVPVDYEAFRIGLTLRLAKEWFRVNHDTILDAHANSITGKLSRLVATSKVSPSYWIVPDNFVNMPYTLIDSNDYNRYMDLIRARLLELGGTQKVIDYTTHPDTAMLPLLVGYDESTIFMTTFFKDIYTISSGVKIIQYNTDSVKALFFGGHETYDGFPELCIDCGEDSVQLVGRKQTDYYTNHLYYVLSSSMTPEYQAVLTDLRNDVHRSYHKVFHVGSILNKNNFGLYTSMSISHLVEQHTLDLLNVVGLSKSIVSLTLTPYRDVYDVVFNKLTVSFDNYNPEKTVTLIDNLSNGSTYDISLVISMSRDFMNVYLFINNELFTFNLPNTDRRYDVDPFFLFVGPRIDYRKKGTLRIQDLRLYGKSLTDTDASALLEGVHSV